MKAREIFLGAAKPLIWQERLRTATAPDFAGAPSGLRLPDKFDANFLTAIAPTTIIAFWS
jgi:hypothetical protein